LKIIDYYNTAPILQYEYLLIIERPEKIARCCDGSSRPFDDVLSRVGYNVIVVHVRFGQKPHRIDSVVLGNIINLSIHKQYVYYVYLGTVFRIGIKVLNASP